MFLFFVLIRDDDQVIPGTGKDVEEEEEEEVEEEERVYHITIPGTFVQVSLKNQCTHSCPCALCHMLLSGM